MSGVDVLAAMDRAKNVLLLCDPLVRSRMPPLMNSLEAQAFNARTEIDEARAAVAELIEAGALLLRHAGSQQCSHEDTHRGGSIWTICSACGCKWADDEGGMPEWKEDAAISDFRTALSRVRGAE